MIISARAPQGCSEATGCNTVAWRRGEKVPSHLARAGFVARDDSRCTVARDDGGRLGLVVVHDLVLFRTTAWSESSVLLKLKGEAAGGRLFERRAAYDIFDLRQKLHAQLRHVGAFLERDFLRVRADGVRDALD